MPFPVFNRSPSTFHPTPHLQGKVAPIGDRNERLTTLAFMINMQKPYIVSISFYNNSYSRNAFRIGAVINSCIYNNIFIDVF